MSFSSSFKEEILTNVLMTAEEKSAFISAVIRMNGSIHIDSKGVNIEVENEHYSLIQKFSEYIKDIYKIEIEIEIIPQTNISPKIFKVKLPSDFTATIANDAGIITYIGDVAVGFCDGVGHELYTEAEIKAYLLGIVACSVSITVPQQTTHIGEIDTLDKEAYSDIYVGGYHLEMVFLQENLAFDIMHYFAQFDILLKKITRGEMFGLYIKGSEMISDFMAFFGASNAVLELANIMVARSLRNDINRANNCAIANIDKSVEAGQKQYKAIKLIEKVKGLDSLPEKLREIANIRLENPDFTLDQVAEIVGVSKSGINHRFRKLLEIANELKEEEVE